MDVVGKTQEETKGMRKKNNRIVMARGVDSGYESFPLDDLFCLYDYQVIEKHSSLEHSP